VQRIGDRGEVKVKREKAKGKREQKREKIKKIGFSEGKFEKWGGWLAIGFDWVCFC
jgi:hypothetical protein